MVRLNEEQVQVQESAQLAGHDLIRFPDIQPLKVPMRGNFIRVFFGMAFVIFIYFAIYAQDDHNAISLSWNAHDIVTMALIAVALGLLATSLIFVFYNSFSVRKKKKQAVLDAVIKQVNHDFGTAFVDDPRQVFVGGTHARDKRFKGVKLFFDSKKRKLLILSLSELFSGNPLAFVEDYDYIRRVEYSSAGGSTTSGVAGFGSVAIPFSFSTSNTNEIAVLLRDPELVEARLAVYGADRHVTDKFRQMAALINP